MVCFQETKRHGSDSNFLISFGKVQTSLVVKHWWVTIMSKRKMEPEVEDSVFGSLLKSKSSLLSLFKAAIVKLVRAEILKSEL